MLQAPDRARGIRPADFSGILGKTYAPPFTDEKWLDVRSPRTRRIMAKRFDYAQKTGCRGVDPDNTMVHEVRLQLQQQRQRSPFALFVIYCFLSPWLT